MSTETAHGRTFGSGVWEWLGRVEATLDEYGKGAWIATMVVGFIVFVPIGLAVLGYMIWSGRMGCRGKWRRSAFRGRGYSARGGSGNSAFDAYRDETMRRLEEEREAFEEFMQRLRKAKDQAEFDQFMSERRASSAAPDAQPAG
ncbi:MAG: DUF2852 domain-containing protein [Neomegalonema sp.]|nr:DUF2852 domain-containing protein [Neomegalonema sp.]